MNFEQPSEEKFFNEAENEFLRGLVERFLREHELDLIPEDKKNYGSGDFAYSWGIERIIKKSDNEAVALGRNSLGGVKCDVFIKKDESGNWVVDQVTSKN